MKQYSFPNRPWARTGIYLFLTAILLLNRDTLYSSTVFGFNRTQFLMAGCMVLAGLLFLLVCRRDWKALLTDRRVYFALACGAVLLLPMAVKRDWQLMYGTVYLAVLFGIFVSLFLTLQDAARMYLNILCVLGVLSVLGTYVLSPLAARGVLPAPVVYNNISQDFYCFGLSFASVTAISFRNFGVFREPGVYQYFLILGLFLNHYEANWDSGKKTWLVTGILALTMVTTFATGGLIEMLLFALVLFFDKGWYRQKSGIIAAGVVVLLGAGLAAYMFLRKGTLYYGFLDAVSKFTTKHDSMTDRVGSIASNTGTFLHAPLFGGILRDTLYAVANNTSSSTLMFALFGILGGVLHAASWVLLAWRRGGKVWTSICLTVILFMSFNTENLITNPYFWLFPLMAVCQRYLPLRGKREAAA